MTSDPTLTEDEHLVLRLHPHWKTLIGPVSVAVLVVAAALIAEVVIPSNSAAAVERLVVAAVAILAVMLWLIVPVLRWRTTTYELTTRRLRVRSGIATRRGRDIPLARINDVRSRRACWTGCSAAAGWWSSRPASTARSC
jgi:Predicted membrane protein